MPRSLIWLRTDLRAHDNCALHHGCQAASAGQEGGAVALYVISLGDWQRHDTAPVRVDFVLRTLKVLSADLGTLGIPLLIRTAAKHGDVAKVVGDVAAEVNATAVFANREYEVNEVARDELAASLLKKSGRSLTLYHDAVVIPPGEVLTKVGGPFTVFSPFKRAWFAVLAGRTDSKGPTILPAPRKQTPLPITSDAVPDHVDGFKSTVPASIWPSGEHEAVARLERFVGKAIRSYKDERNFPGVEGTSALSPYLAAGIISPRLCLAKAMEANHWSADGGNAGIATWISELIWREFYKHVLVAFPRVCMNRAFKLDTESIQWSRDKAHFEAWCTGHTGYPIVDAAQRQLLATGWMHNRLRMISSMFLTKDLLIDWHWGEKHFMRHLVDGDLAANNGGWQWSASTGTDAAPYFRIFNPTTQSAKFDATGDFIRPYVPELASLSADDIHDPPPMARMRLNYPMPIVDHAAARLKTLKAFKMAGSLNPDYPEAEYVE